MPLYIFRKYNGIENDVISIGNISKPISNWSNSAFSEPDWHLDSKPKSVFELRWLSIGFVSWYPCMLLCTIIPFIQGPGLGARVRDKEKKIRKNEAVQVRCSA